MTEKIKKQLGFGIVTGLALAVGSKILKTFMPKKSLSPNQRKRRYRKW